MKKTLSTLGLLLFLFLTAGCDKVDKLSTETPVEDKIPKEEIVVSEGEALIPAIEEAILVDEEVIPETQTEPVDLFKPYSYFSIDNLKVGLAEGWVLKNEIIDKETGDKAFEFTKDNYVLYINPNAKVTSGVKGGTFSELASRATGPQAIIKYFPGSPCGEKVEVQVSDKLMRKDHFVGPDAHQDYEKVSCNIPKKNNVWYFSYFVMKGERYFNDKSKWDPESGEEGLFIATLTYAEDGKKLLEKDFPAWDAEKLQMILEEVSQIVDHIKFGNFSSQKR